MTNRVSFLNWGNVALHHPSAFLLAAQLLSLILYVALEAVPGQQFILGIFGMLVLLLVVWVVIHSPAINWIAWIIASLAILFSALSWLLSNPELLIWAALS
ncbi:MAG: two pore domain potassium channel family protein, partial [Smithellaceae bacterium]